MSAANLPALEKAHRDAVAAALDTGIAELTALLAAGYPVGDNAARVRWRDRCEDLERWITVTRVYVARRWNR